MSVGGIVDLMWGDMPEIIITLNRRTSGERGGVRWCISVTHYSNLQVKIRLNSIAKSGLSNTKKNRRNEHS